MTAASGIASAQTRIEPRWNRFSEQDDIDIGKKSVVEAEKKLKLVADPVVLAYVREIGARLVSKSRGPSYPYTFKVVDDKELNAFALPGGPIYLNRGVLESARNDGEVAGVLGHEIAHVVLRHGTANMSKASVAQTGLGVLGGLLGKVEATKNYAGLIEQAGGFGLNMVFLKYSRDAETEADVYGSQILARSGFNPADMVGFFETLEKATKGNKSSTANWLASHPTPDRRIERIEEEARLLKVKPMRTQLTAGLAPAQTALGRKPAAGASAGSGMGSAATSTGQTAGSTTAKPGGAPVRTAAPLKVVVAAPASDMKTYQNAKGAYRLSYPANWTVRSDGKTAATIAPPSGTPEVAGHPEVVYGAMVNEYRNFGNDAEKEAKDDDDPDRAPVGARLEAAFGDLRAQALAASPHLSRVKGSGRGLRTADGRRRGIVMSGTNPRTGIAEQVTIVARELKDGRIVYFLFVTPQSDAAAYDATLRAMMDSLKGPGAKG